MTVARTPSRPCSRASWYAATSVTDWPRCSGAPSPGSVTDVIPAARATSLAAPICSATCAAVLGGMAPETRPRAVSSSSPSAAPCSSSGTLPPSGTVNPVRPGYPAASNAAVLTTAMCRELCHSHTGFSGATASSSSAVGWEPPRWFWS